MVPRDPTHAAEPVLANAPVFAANVFGPHDTKEQQSQSRRSSADQPTTGTRLNVPVAEEEELDTANNSNNNDDNNDGDEDDQDESGRRFKMPPRSNTLLQSRPSFDICVHCGHNYVRVGGRFHKHRCQKWPSMIRQMMFPRKLSAPRPFKLGQLDARARSMSCVEPNMADSPYGPASRTGTAAGTARIRNSVV